MRIEKSTIDDVAEMKRIFAFARRFMALNGNSNQWINGYPSDDVIFNDIRSGNSYVCRNIDGRIFATFAFFIGVDPTYSYIEGGQWLNDFPYGVVHRLASDGTEKGVGAACLEWCFGNIRNLRVDTHHDNTIMQNLLKKMNFTYCGIIITHNGTPRLAYQSIR
jgi:RimJ/RimL family protein N-acetyltransferase